MDRADYSSPITPEILSELIRIDVPRGVILVQGIAEDVSEPWKRGGAALVFGRLTLGSSTIRFQVPAEGAPGEGEAVVMQGTLRVRAVTRGHTDLWRGAYEITLVGHTVGSWAPRESDTAIIPLPARDERLPLSHFIEQNRLDDLVVLCTQTARADIMRSLGSFRHEARPTFLDASFADERAFLETLAKLRNSRSAQGIAVTRGGGGGLDVIGGSRPIIKALIDTGLPFYTALGHASDVTLIDKFADQAYHTPSEFGSAIGRAMQMHAERIRQERLLVEQAQTIKTLMSQVSGKGGGRSPPWLLILAILFLALMAWVMGWVQFRF